jgi:hypothetical protein
MKMKLRLESPDVKIYLVLLLVIGEIVYSCRAAFTANRAIKWIYDRHLFIVIVNTSGGDSPASYWDENYAQPYFDNTTRRDLTVTIGQTALLHCRVRNLGDRAVSMMVGVLSALSVSEAGGGLRVLRS